MHGEVIALLKQDHQSWKNARSGVIITAKQNGFSAVSFDL